MDSLLIEGRKSSMYYSGEILHIDWRADGQLGNSVGFSAEYDLPGPPPVAGLWNPGTAFPPEAQLVRIVVRKVVDDVETVDTYDKCMFAGIVYIGGSASLRFLSQQM